MKWKSLNKPIKQQMIAYINSIMVKSTRDMNSSTWTNGQGFKPY